MYTLSKGYPSLGCVHDEEGLRFGIYAPTALEMMLNIYLEVDQLTPYAQILLNRLNYATGDLFHILIRGLPDQVYYTWQIIYRDNSKSEELLDPYAKSVIPSPHSIQKYRGASTKEVFQPVYRPVIPLSETIIYELHVGAFTKSPTSNVDSLKKGTFEGLIEKLPYLKTLGITTLELLPIFKWNPYTLKQKHPDTDELMTDVWGYNPISFFAIENSYGVGSQPLDEIVSFKKLVHSIHSLGMEIILDVVYNHTGEGGEDGTIFNFKALAQESYYKLKDGAYLNCSGTGNTLNCTHPVVKQLILDSLKYWVIHMGVDGFRFDLASILGQDEYGRWMQHSVLVDIAQDPILSKVKLISESWDAKGSYDVGRMPYPFAEWSDYFRDTIRKFMRGDLGLTKQVANCILGEEVYYTDHRKNANHSIHFITAHDGFTLWDLVSYEYKHNEKNGEDNRDGNNSNYSANCGIEGATSISEINTLRKRRVKNFLALLLLSKGIPMLLMGDELGRTQQGNNNAYCQDNDLMWIDWARAKSFESLTEFVKEMILIRKKMGHFKGYSKENVTWHGVGYNQPDWSYYSRTLAWHYKTDQGSLYVVVNSYVESLYFELPPTLTCWRVVVDTFEDTLQFIQHDIIEKGFIVRAYSLCIFMELESKKH